MSSTTAAEEETKDFSPKIIGLYGLSGAGKSTMLEYLKEELGDLAYSFINGSEMIDQICPDGLRGFKQLDADEKKTWREKAIVCVREKCERESKHAIVAGHCVFWQGPADEELTWDKGQVAWTAKDEEVYTHVLYLEVDAKELEKRRAADKTRARGSVPAGLLEDWQKRELEVLREVCYRSFKPLMTIKDDREKALGAVKAFVKSDADDCEVEALERFTAELDQLDIQHIDTALVFDADKTLTEVDVGDILCKYVDRPGAFSSIFNSRLEYSPAAFYQQMLVIEELIPEDEWDDVCEKLADKFTLFPEMEEILGLAVKKPNIEVVIVTCGFAKVLKKVLERDGLDGIHIVGNGRLRDGVVVTPEMKQRIVQFLQTEKNAFVWAFGDSQLDLPMLVQADKAVVVVCNEQLRSKSMDKLLADRVANNGLLARQLLLTSTATPRLDSTSSPIVPIVHTADILSEIPLADKLHVLHATNRPASKMLAAPTRDKEAFGPALQLYHHRVGYYLAIELLPEITGLEPYDMTSVQGKPSRGHRIRNGDETVIVSVMRGGDPLARGVFDTLPSAVYVHAHKPVDLADRKHRQAIEDAKTVLVCDFVINNGESMLEMVQQVRKLNRTARVVMMAGVVQAGSIREDGELAKGLRGVENVALVALRLSENKYPGKGSTDTGGRLFNTTEVEQAE